MGQSGIADSIVYILPGMARSTLMEAKAVSDFIRQGHPVDSLLIITSAAHSRRAYLIFNDQLNNQQRLRVALFTYPSPYSNFNSQHWFAHKEDIQSTLTEFLKILSYYLFER